MYTHTYFEIKMKLKENCLTKKKKFLVSLLV